MIAKITPSKLNGEITAPPSKSFAHRLIISACLSKKEASVLNVGDSKDVIATANAMQSLGFDCYIENNNFYVKGYQKKDEAVINCLESGSTMRFLIPVALALGCKATFTGSEKLMQRPIDALCDCLKSHNITIDGHSFCGKLTGGKFIIDASVSSQFVTGLLLALPILPEDSEIEVIGKKVSAPYIDITLSVLEKSGIKIEKKKSGFFIGKNQKYDTPKVSICEGDWSGSAFFIAGGALFGDISIKGLNINSPQGDKKIVDILKEMGADIKIEQDNIRAKIGNKLHAVEIDCANTPDIAQIVAVCCAMANGTSKIHGIENLSVKESDREKAILDMLNGAGIKAESDGKTITIKGGSPQGFILDAKNDHRTVMSASILATGASGKSQIIGAEASKKSYPKFFDDYTKLGGNVNVDI